MKKLEKQFVKKGFKYTQIIRKGNVAIFKQEKSSEEVMTPKYEVVVIKSHNGYEIGGQKIPPGEVYPSSSQWGLIGWTYQGLEDAEKKFKKLLLKQS